MAGTNSGHAAGAGAVVAFGGGDGAGRRGVLVGRDGGEERRQPQIATGNWGCGAFGGDVYLKFVIQVIRQIFVWVCLWI